MSVVMKKPNTANEEVAVTRDTFGSKFGIVAAAAGSAVGLGNVWRFPYIVGENGGGAFILIYLACILVVGMAAMLCEFLIGRRTGTNAVQAFKKLAPNTPWFLTGWMGIITSVLILSFYSGVAGWCIHYMIASLMGGFTGLDAGGINQTFGAFITGYEPIFYQMIILFITAGVVFFGVKKGIERVSKILMPLLVVLLVLLGVNSLMLPNAVAGFEFLFKPDWSGVTPESILIALGHSFFTLSVGMGVMMTYGSYIKKSDNLGTSVVSITAADTSIALLAGIVIFPAVFSFGLEAAEGPGLVFVTLPHIFNNMPFGQLLGGVFFFLLTIAAITSTISLLEVNVAYLQDTFNWKRSKSTIAVISVIVVTSIICSLSNTEVLGHIKLFGLNFFDFADKVTNDYLMPIGGLFIVLFTGWYMKKEDIVDELTVEGQKPWYVEPFLFIVKFVAPVLIAIVFLNTIGLVG